MDRILAERTHAGDLEGNEKLRYLLADHLGSSSMALESNGEIQWISTYRPYGLDTSFVCQA